MKGTGRKKKEGDQVILMVIFFQSTTMCLTTQVFQMRLQHLHFIYQGFVIGPFQLVRADH